ncbi:MAG: RNA methyltransferase [Ignavibacteria bacterium]|nr:RNA methyltransferase [Ignavibacteria bacterium]MBK7185746.1 RNA methyltransferase [Ignavibacteria bacterium]
MNEIRPRCPHNLRNAIRELQRSSEREKTQQFLAEGPHACGDLLSAGIDPKTVVLRDDASEECRAIAEAFERRGANVYGSGSKDMGLMADAAAPQDILLVAPFFTEAPLGERVVILDAVSDPGNVGTIIRSAVWFGCTDTILGEGCADLYNPKVVRSTAGALARINVLRKRTIVDMIPELGQRPIIAASARGGAEPAVLRDMSTWALLIGSEAHGLHDDINALATMSITIPGGHGTESLNAAVAASILLYEARR